MFCELLNMYTIYSYSVDVDYKIIGSSIEDHLSTDAIENVHYMYISKIFPMVVK